MSEASEAMNKAYAAYKQKPDAATFKRLKEQLINLAQGAIYRIFNEHKNPGVLAEDIAADILATLPTYGGKAMFSTWAFGIARRKALDALRHETGGRRSNALPKSAKAFETPSPEVLADLYSHLSSADLAENEVAFISQIIGPHGLRHPLSDADRKRLSRIRKKLGH